MEEEIIEKSESDFKLCGSCGAVIDKDSQFCKRCGAPVATDAEADEKSEQPAAADPLEKDKADAHKIDPFEVEPSAPAETFAAERKSSATSAKFCMRCGTELQSGYKFCRNCGTPVGEIATSAYYQNPSANAANAVAADSRTKNKRIAGGILYIIGAVISILFGFIFFCMPFLTITVNAFTQSASCSQNGFTFMFVMFGMKSDLVEAGVNSTLLTWGSWLYFAFFIALIYHGICVALNVSRYIKGNRPYNIVQSSVLLPVLGVMILVVGIIARVQAGGWVNKQIDGMGEEYAPFFEMSSYLGFIAIFVLSLIGFICVMTGYGISSNTFPPHEKKKKKTGAVLAIFITDLVCGVIIGLSAIAPVVGSFSYNTDKEISIGVDDSGKAKLTCDDTYRGYYVGATVFKLDSIQGDFIFRIDTDDVSQDALVGSIALVHYDDVKNKSASEIFEAVEQSFIGANDRGQTGEGYAYYNFSAGYDDEYAIVVGFTATGNISIRYEYSLEYLF